MKMLYLAVLAAAFTLQAQGGKCTNPGLIFTITSPYTDPLTGAGYNSGLLSDGNGPYANGGGVTAVLDLCNGSDGATLTPGSNRKVWLLLSNLVGSTTLTPAWTSQPAPILFLTIPFGLNVSNTTGNYSFTTYLKVTMASPNSGYYFNMENPNATAPFNPPGSDENVPCTASIVHVQHTAAVAGVSAETWTVWPDSTPIACGNSSFSQIGTLGLSSPPKKGPVNAGQFSVPFYITIQRQ